MWDLPGPGLEPVSPALAGGCLTTVPPGKPKRVILKASSLTKLLTSNAQEEKAITGTEWG